MRALRNELAKLVMFLAVLAVCMPANAQVTTPQADPGRIEQQIQGREFRVKPKSDVSAVRAQGDMQIPKKFYKIKFNLKKIIFSGVSVYNSDELKALYKRKIGKQVSLADVYKVANALTAKYRADGYILSRALVPTQKVKNGIVKIKVVEGFVDKINIDKSGEVRGSLELIKTYANKIAAEKPLRNQTLERYLLLANELPGISVQSVLTPSPKTVGAADLRLIVKQEKFNYRVSMDNRGTRYMGPMQASIAANINSPLAMHDNLSLIYAGAPSNGNELNYVGANYSLPVFDNGTTLRLSASYTETDAGYNLSVFDVEGESYRFSAGLDHSFIRSRAKNLKGSISFENKQSENKANIGGLTFKDRLSVMRAGLAGSYADRFSGYNSMSVELSQGINMLGATDDIVNDDLSRSRGVSDFTKATFSASRLQDMGSHFLLNLAVKGQKSANTLLSSEEFGLGGSSFGRGYDSSEITGEDALAFSAEIRYDALPPCDYVDSLQFYTFYDAGTVWNRGEAEARESLTSLGGGIKVQVLDSINGSIEVAKPLGRNVDAEGNENPRVFASLGYTF